MTETKSPEKKRRSARKWASRIGWAFAVLVAVAAVVWSLRPKPQKVDVAEVTRGQLDVTLDDDGRTRVRARYTVSAPLLGRVLRLELGVGDEIEEGQVLATFVPQPTPLLDGRTLAEAEARSHAAGAAVHRASSSVDGAKTALELARSEAERARKLFGEGALSKAALDQAQSAERLRVSDLATAEFAAQVARHDAELSRVVLSRSQAGSDAKAESIVVTAPAKGRLLRVIQESEGVVAPGTPLLEIGDPQNLEIVVDVLSSDAVHVRPGQPATVLRWGGEPLNAHVRLVEPSAVTKLSSLGVEEQRVNVVLDLDDPRDRWAALGDGYRVEVSIVVESHADAIRVPTGALFRKGPRSYVYVIEGGVARERAVEILARGASVVAVTEGVAPGDRLVLHPSDRIAEGTQVEPR